jgi:hypothetical protein
MAVLVYLLNEVGKGVLGWVYRIRDSKAVNREDKLSRRYRVRDLAKFERSRRYRER